MAATSYLDEFKRNYEKPQVDGLIVGFSGIDPQRKSSGSGSSCNCDNSKLSDAQKQIVLGLIRESLSVIDFSHCDCDPTQLTDAQKNIIYQLIQERLDELDVCNCDNSTLTDEQKEIVKTIINERLEEFILNFDGGNIDDDDDNNNEPVPIDPATINHENLNGLLGGDSKGHYHLTQEELLKIAAYPSFSDIKHEAMPDLLGGNSNGHFHLDDNELRKLRIMINSFFPDGSDNLIIEVKPVAPDNPVDDSDIYGGLPSGTPPPWELRMLPSKMEAADYGKVFYYGDLRADNENKLFAQLKTTTATAQQYTYSSTDAQSWTYEYECTSAIRKVCSDSGVIQYVYLDNPPNGLFSSTAGNPTFKWYIVVIPKVADSGKFTYFRKMENSGGNITFGSFTATPDTKYNYKAGCYSPLLKSFILATDKKSAFLKSADNSTWGLKNTGLTVNPACAAWHPTTAVFCLTGKEGTSTSFDGKTWTLNSDAPHDLRDLSYRQDIDNFIAWSGEDKTLYTSVDGINWNQLSDVPIPLDNISTVIYEPSNQWFCAVGIGDGNAYFSKNLKAWIPTKLRNNSPVDVADVIFMPSTGLYVAMPTSGTYYYTFNPANWTN